MDANLFHFDAFAKTHHILQSIKGEINNCYFYFLMRLHIPGFPSLELSPIM